MITPLDVNVNDSTLWTIALVAFIVCAVIYIITWILGRWRP